MRTRQASPTFSEVWYKVAQGRPRISPHASITRQRFGGETAFVVEESATGTFFRISEAAYRFVGLLDGRRTVDEAWEACAAQLGDDAPTQTECIDLLASMDMNGLLLGDLPMWADTLEHRQANVAGAKRAKRTGSGLFPCIPLINPERFLSRSLHLYRWMFGPTGATLWILIVGIAIVMLVSNVGRFGNELDISAMLDPSNVVVLGLVFLVLRIVHELGHAMACKAMGGRCTEIGVMLVALIMPLPYCDATSSWRFPATWRRVLVAAGGVYFETFIAAIAAILWARSDPGMFSGICRNVMVISGVSTLAFNLNPLLRYDGYYILSDVLGIPNLAQRSNEMWRYAAARYAFGVASAKPPAVRSRREAIIVSIYATLSIPYRLVVSLTICLVVAQRYSSLGLLLGAACLTLMVVWPMLKGIGYLLWSPMLLGRRVRAVSVIIGVGMLLGVLLGLVPVRERVYAPAWLRARESAVLRAAENGFVAEVLAGVGATVAAGDPLVRMESEELRAAHGASVARLAQARAALDEATIKSAADARAAEAQVVYAAEEVDALAERLESLVIRSPVSGQLIASGATTAEWSNLAGSYLARGSMIGHVSSVGHLEIRALVDDRDFGYAFARSGISHASARVKGSAGRVIPVSIVRVGPAGSLDVDNPAMANVSGGEIAVRQAGQKSLTALTPQFAVDLEPRSGESIGLIGQRARVRFEMERSPLIEQWARRARQFWNARFGA